MLGGEVGEKLLEIAPTKVTLKKLEFIFMTTERI
jgi:hypothetical protein